MAASVFPPAVGASTTRCSHRGSRRSSAPGRAQRAPTEVVDDGVLQVRMKALESQPWAIRPGACSASGWPRPPRRAPPRPRPRWAGRAWRPAPRGELRVVELELVVRRRVVVASWMSTRSMTSTSSRRNRRGASATLPPKPVVTWLTSARKESIVDTRWRPAPGSSLGRGRECASPP
jgi:hypothetical protein